MSIPLRLRAKHQIASIAMTALLTATLGLAGCSSMGHTSQPTLYSQLGGEKGISAVVHAFVLNVAHDQRINARFAHVNIPHLEAQLTAFFCQETGGPQVYTGPDMYAVHKGMHITNAQWTAFMTDFELTLKQEKVPQLQQARLLGLLEPMKSEIVGK